MAVKNETETPVEEKVTINIPSTDKETEAVFFSVNNQTFLVPRDTDVEVPWYVAELYRELVAAQRKNRAKLNALSRRGN